MTPKGKYRNFQECCEDEAKQGNSYASHLLHRSNEKNVLKVAMEEGRRQLDIYKRQENAGKIISLQYQLERAEELGMLDGSFEMTYEGAERIYNKVREIVRKKQSRTKRGSESINFLDILDVFDPEIDSSLIATGMLCLVPEVREHLMGREDGLYKAVLNVGAHKRSGYTLPIHKSSKPSTYQDVLSPRLKALLEAIPEAKTSEDEEAERMLKVLIHKRAEREVFPIFKRDTIEAFSKLEHLIAKEKNDCLHEEYQLLREKYHNYLDFEVIGVNPEFVDPNTGERNVLPSLHQRIGIYGIVNEERFGIWDGGGTGKTAQVVLAQPLIEKILAEEGKKFRRAIIVGPNRCKSAWKKGLTGSDRERYLAERQDIFVMNGERKTDEILQQIGDAKWIVTNYDQLITRINGEDRLFVDELVDMGADFVAFDEGHNIKGKRTTTRPSEQWPHGRLTQSAAARMLALSARFFISISEISVTSASYTLIDLPPKLFLTKSLNLRSCTSFKRSHSSFVGGSPSIAILAVMRFLPT